MSIVIAMMGLWGGIMVKSAHPVYFSERTVKEVTSVAFTDHENHTILFATVILKIVYSADTV